MIGKFTATFDRVVRDTNGGYIVSFVSSSNDTHQVGELVESIQSCVTGGKERLTIEVSKEKKKRSLNANAYFWQLCEQIAKKLNTTKLEIYKKSIYELGIFKQITINADAVETFKTAWGMNGTGWVVEVVDKANMDGFMVIHAYYGSSVYSVKQMTRLIDGIVEDCKELGIETKTPEEIQSLINLEKSIKN